MFSLTYGASADEEYDKELARHSKGSAKRSPKKKVNPDDRSVSTVVFSNTVVSAVSQADDKEL